MSSPRPGEGEKEKNTKKTEKEQGKQRLPYSYPGATLKLPRSRPEAQPTKATTLHLPYSYPTLTLHLPYSYPIATLDSRREKYPARVKGCLPCSYPIALLDLDLAVPPPASIPSPPRRAPSAQDLPQTPAPNLPCTPP